MNSRYLFGGLISLKKAEVFGVKLGCLKSIQVMSYPRPGLLASLLGNAFYQQGKNTDFDMDLNPMRQPMEHWSHFNLSLFE